MEFHNALPEASHDCIVQPEPNAQSEGSDKSVTATKRSRPASASKASSKRKKEDLASVEERLIRDANVATEKLRADFNEQLNRRDLAIQQQAEAQIRSLQQLTEVIGGLSAKLEKRQQPISVSRPRPPSTDLDLQGTSGDELFPELGGQNSIGEANDLSPYSSSYYAQDDDSFETSVVGLEDACLPEEEGDSSLDIPSALVPDLAPDHPYHVAADRFWMQLMKAR